MRTKTALLTGALSLAAAATTFAQVYSVNTVGYVNMTLVPGFQLVANPLNNTAANGNTVGVLFGTSLPEGSAIYKFVNGKYDPSNFYNDLDGWTQPNQGLAPGEGTFLKLAGTVNKTVTFVGDVVQNPAAGQKVTITLNKGYNMVASKVPQAGKLQTDLGYVPMEGDRVYKFTPGVGYENTYSYNDLDGWMQGATAKEPSLAVGEGVWLYSPNGGTWERDFTVK